MHHAPENALHAGLQERARQLQRPLGVQPCRTRASKPVGAARHAVGQDIEHEFRAEVVQLEGVRAFACGPGCASLGCAAMQLVPPRPAALRSPASSAPRVTSRVCTSMTARRRGHSRSAAYGWGGLPRPASLKHLRAARACSACANEPRSHVLTQRPRIATPRSPETSSSHTLTCRGRAAAARRRRPPRGVTAPP